jgi:hypothetical protein
VNVLTVILDFPQAMKDAGGPEINDLDIALTPGIVNSYDQTLWLSNTRLQIIYDPVSIEPTSGDLTYVNTIGFLQTAGGGQYDGFVLPAIPIT